MVAINKKTNEVVGLLICDCQNAQPGQVLDAQSQYGAPISPDLTAHIYQPKSTCNTSARALRVCPSYLSRLAPVFKLCSILNADTDLSTFAPSDSLRVACVLVFAEANEWRGSGLLQLLLDKGLRLMAASGYTTVLLIVLVPTLYTL